MTRPRVFDYDPASDEEVVIVGAEGVELGWFGISINRQIVHIVCNEGNLIPSGDEIDTVVRPRLQETLEGQDCIDFYTANKDAIDSLMRAAFITWATRRGKTGTVIES